MPITFKTGAADVKGKDGKFTPVNVLVGGTPEQVKAIEDAGKAYKGEIETTGEAYKSDIETTGEAHKSDIETTGEAYKAEIDETGARVLASIPDDYSELNQKVLNVSESITEISNRLKSGSIEDSELHLGFYLDDDGDLCQKEV